MSLQKPFTIEEYIIFQQDRIALALGDVPGVTHVNKFGKNSDVSTSLESIWNGGDAYTGFDPTGAETLDVYSGNLADDAATGQGAWTVELFGLDGDWEPVSETVTLDGETPVTTTQTFIRMNRAIVRTAGTLGWNVGEITAEQSTSTDVMMVMPALYNQTMIACYTIPAGKKALLTGWAGSIAKKQAAYADVRLVSRPFGEVFQVKEELTLSSVGSSFIPRIYNPYKGVYAAKTDIQLETVADSAGNGISGAFDLLLVDI